MELANIDRVETGERIRKIMRKRGISILDVQMALKFTTPSNIYAWRRGERLPSVENLFQLAQILNCRMDDIIVKEIKSDGNKKRTM